MEGGPRTPLPAPPRRRFAGPPVAPHATAPRPDEQAALTSVSWSRAQAYGLVFLTFASIVGTGLLLTLPGLTGIAEAAPTVVRGSAVFADYALLLGVVWLLARRKGSAFAPAVGLRAYPPGRALGLGVLFAFLARTAVLVWVLLLAALDVTLPGADVDVTRLLPATPVGVALTVLVAVVVAPIAEETVFRGVLLPALLARHREWVAFGLSALLFSVLHFNQFTFVPILVLGLALAWLFARTRTLWTPIAAHAVFNLVAVAAAYAQRFSR